MFDVVVNWEDGEKEMGERTLGKARVSQYQSTSTEMVPSYTPICSKNPYKEGRYYNNQKYQNTNKHLLNNLRTIDKFVEFPRAS